MGQSVVVEHLWEMIRDLRKLGDDAAKERIQQANVAVAQAVAIAAAQRAPRRSGRLAFSVRPLASRRAAKVKAGGGAGALAVPYAGPIHFGWHARNIQPQPFIYDAADALRDEATGVFETVVEELVRLVNDSK